VNALVRSLDAQISLMVASASKISKNEVHDRLFSNDEGMTLTVAPAARAYWDDLRKIKLSPEFKDLEFFEQELVKAWLRAFNFSDGQFAIGYTLKNDEEWTYVEHWHCKQCGVFEMEVMFDDLDDPLCPICEGEMEYVPQIIEEFATRADSMAMEIPYATVEENDTFWQAQRGSYDAEDDGQDPDMWDDADLRDPNEEGAWAEYLEPVGMGEFYGSAEWQALRQATQDAIAEADYLIGWYGKGQRHTWKSGSEEFACLHPSQKWPFVKEVIRPAVEDVWAKAEALYITEAINAVAMAMVVHRMVSATKFSREEMVELTKALPAKSHVDGTPLGHSFFEWMQDFREELDDILEDGAGFDDSPRYPNEEQRVANTWVAHFERELEEWWKYQAKLRTPVPVENGAKIWSGAWTGPGDVAYNLAYLRAIACALPKAEVKKVAEDAKKSARWSPNDTWVIGANPKGLVLNNQSVIAWSTADTHELIFPIPQREGILKAMRAVWKVAQPSDQSEIARVGQAVKAL
jgi:hypothetical protein